MSTTHHQPHGAPTQKFDHTVKASKPQQADAPAGQTFGSAIGNEDLAALLAAVQQIHGEALGGNASAAAVLDSFKNAIAAREAAEQAAIANAASTTAVVSAAANETPAGTTSVLAAAQTNNPKAVPVAATVIADPKGVTTESVTTVVPAETADTNKFQTMVAETSHQHGAGAHVRK